MSRNHFFSLSALAILFIATFVLTDNTRSTANMDASLHADVATLEFLNVDKITNVENKLQEDGTYFVTITSLKNGETVQQNFEALDYSPEGNCLCNGCDQEGPIPQTSSDDYKRKLIIGSKCWCLYCIDIPRN